MAELNEFLILSSRLCNFENVEMQFVLLMKKLLYLICTFAVLFTLKSHAAVPEGAIPFIFDSHLYLQATLNDTVPVTVIYDTGADFLYLDEDYLKLNNLQNAFGRKGVAKMGGAGNSEPQRVEIFVDSVEIRCGELDYWNKITPIIRLRDILGRYIDGLLGNTHLLSSPLEISFSEGYLKQWEAPFPVDSLENYHKLEARFEDNRIDVKASLQIDSANAVEGWFRLDLGSGSTVSLTNEATSSLHLDDMPKAYFRTQAGGVGGGSEDVEIRAARFCMVDTFENVVIDCSLNEKGALSSGRPYLGIIGNDIWSLYDMVLDPVRSSVWVKRNGKKGTYSQSSTTHMAVFDRTDICDGWIVNGLYKGGIAEQAGIEIGDVIIAINDRSVKEISWEEQRNGLNLKGETKYTVRKANGEVVTYTLFVQKQII